MPSEPCEEKTRLLLEYQKATEMYSQKVAELAKNIGIIAQAEYKWLTKVSEACRHESADARDRLERHIAQHGC